MKVVLEIGDVVFLTSDVEVTTPMTVEDLYDCEDCGIDAVDVVWADFGEIKRDTFPASCLVALIDDEE